jgi:uncharacterized repeat protein (TIGR02543 family)
MILMACDQVETTETTSSLSTTSSQTTTTQLTTLTTQTTTLTTTTQTTTTQTTASVITYQVIFDSNGGNTIDSINAERGYPILLPVPFREGYTFLGWYTSKDPYVYEFTLFTQVVSNMTLYAKWGINQYNIDFDTQGGQTIATQIFDFNAKIVLPTPTKTGHTFVGWYADEDFLSPFNVNLMPSQNLLVYAKWSKNLYQLTIHYTYPVDAIETFRLFGKGYGYTIAVTNSDKIFAWGLNLSGQLGNGNKINQNYPIEITNNIPLNDSEFISKIECGNDFTILLTNHSRIFAFGNNSSYQLAISTGVSSSIPVDITELLKLQVDETIVDISSGVNFTILLTSEGRILTWGSNFNGQLGDLGDTYDFKIHDITSNFGLDSSDRIIMIKAGNTHGIAFSNDKKIFTWGGNFSGQLGDGTTLSKTLPIDITSSISFNPDETISMIVAKDYNLLLTSKNRIFAWGNNYNGNFGNGNTTNSLIPILITPDFNLGVGEMIVKITAGNNHTVALSSNYRIFIWGSNYYGEFESATPLTSSVPMEITETLLTELKYPVIDITAGGNSTIVMASNGYVVTWGNSLYGQLGNNEDVYFHRPKIYLKEIMQIYYNEAIEYGIPTIEGYIFNGWYSDQERENDVEYVFMPAEDLELYGHFIKNE